MDRPNGRRMSLTGHDPSQPLNTEVELIARKVSPSLGILVTIAATKAVTTPTGTGTSAQILAADASRLGATIVNTDPASTLFLGVNGATAVIGSGIAIAPAAAYQLTDPQINGQVNGIWNGTPTVGASIAAYTA